VSRDLSLVREADDRWEERQAEFAAEKDREADRVWRFGWLSEYVDRAAIDLDNQGLTLESVRITPVADRKARRIVPELSLQVSDVKAAAAALRLTDATVLPGDPILGQGWFDGALVTLWQVTR
jgi:hypothetical protein